MYLRTTRRKNRDGTEAVYYQLAHNTWNVDTRRSDPQIVHNFGRADELDARGAGPPMPLDRAGLRRRGARSARR